MITLQLSRLIQRIGVFILTAGLSTALLCTSSPIAMAAKFANQFIEFELPPQWQCNLESAEWVCQSTVDAKKRDAIIVLAAKIKGPQDSLDQYLAHLKAQKGYTPPQGKPVFSEVKYAKTADVNGQAWVDALHLNSELAGFYTRYLATIKLDIGVLVTYSINKDKYQQYLPDLDNMVRTLKVFRKAGGLNSSTPGNLFEIKVPQNISESTVFPTVIPEGGSDVAKTSKQDDNTLYYIIGIAAAVGFFLIRRRRGG